MIIRFKFIADDRSDNINKNKKDSATCKDKERISGNCACRGKIICLHNLTVALAEVLLWKYKLRAWCLAKLYLKFNEILL